MATKTETPDAALPAVLGDKLRSCTTALGEVTAIDRGSRACTGAMRTLARPSGAALRDAASISAASIIPRTAAKA